MKKQDWIKLIAVELIILAIGILIIASVSGYICQDETDLSNIPCELITPLLSCVGNASVLNLNTSVQFNITLNNIGGNIYNGTFNRNTSSYAITLCDNSTATMNVGDYPRDDFWKMAIMIGIIGMAVMYAIYGKILFEKERWMLKSLFYISAVFLIIIGIATSSVIVFSNVFNSMLLVSTIVSISGLSITILYILIFASISLFRAVRESKNEQKTRL